MTLANNWPDGGEQPLSRREMLVMGFLGVVLVALVVGCLLLIALRFFGPVSWPIRLSAVGLALLAGLLWVRPWETEPPRR
jgi:uncharacterized membrane protein YbhN (UPF0104 family)